MVTNKQTDLQTILDELFTLSKARFQGELYLADCFKTLEKRVAALEATAKTEPKPETEAQPDKWQKAVDVVRKQTEAQTLREIASSMERICYTCAMHEDCRPRLYVDIGSTGWPCWKAKS